MPRTMPSALRTKVGQTSLAQESSVSISTRRTSGGSIARAVSYCSGATSMVTSSERAMAAATAAKAFRAGQPPLRQESPRVGQISRQPACRSNSAGMQNPSVRGVVCKMCMIGFLSFSSSFSTGCLIFVESCPVMTVFIIAYFFWECNRILWAVFHEIVELL